MAVYSERRSVLTIDPGRFIFACRAFGMLYRGVGTLQCRTSATSACYESLCKSVRPQGDVGDVTSMRLVPDSQAVVDRASIAAFDISTSWAKDC
jgi:hypothetical protein